MRRNAVVSLACLFALAPVALRAQVPPIINYQSSIMLAGTNFHGPGQFKFALVDRQGSITYWSNDGTSTQAGEPRSSVSLTVVAGAYEVALGDASLSNMVPMSPTVFANPDVHVRVWFSDGQLPFQHVAPDQPLVSTGYAMMAANVADGVVTSAKIADGAVTAGKLASKAVTSASIAPGSVSGSQLAPNAAAANLQASGALILSDQASATNLLQAGFHKMGTVVSAGEQWVTNAPYYPAGRANHLAVWTGSEMIVLGGNRSETGAASRLLEQGASYSPTSDTWIPIASQTPSYPPYGFPMVGIWTDQEVIVLSIATMSRAYDPAKVLGGRSRQKTLLRSARSFPQYAGPDARF